MKTRNVNIGPRISESTSKFLEETFSNRNAGAELILAAFPPLYKRQLQLTLAKLTQAEKSLLLDVHNAYAITPQFVGQGVYGQVQDAIELDQSDKKWNVNKRSILKKLSAMPVFDLACLEIWATAYWQANHYESQSPEEYTK